MLHTANLWGRDYSTLQIRETEAQKSKNLKSHKLEIGRNKKYLTSEKTHIPAQVLKWIDT